eukprot:TRINITY_DN15109_c0_g1_i2.p1 TRINITY_DN15109_c0_g1~~TRINITY_DN15109_c0_g1_i2.p1  ORF type:complete len:663 (+),score=131.39 TRINITY_DN15109_c0_g1_i2:220-2208(+)
MNFSSYFVLSTLIVFGIVAHAYVAHEQFYPAVVYLSTDKMCLAVMYNFAFALFLLFGKVLLRTFIGTLRDLEVEQLVDSGRAFLADTILFLVFYAPTIDNQEVGTVYLIQYICCVIFMKVFHLTTQIRVSHMFEVGVPRLIVNIKLVALMTILLSCDLIACQYFYNVASRSSTFFTWILFEALTMSSVVVVSICKYSVHMVDLRLDNGWPGKSVCLFYIDLIHDVLSMTLFLVFMLTFFVQNPSRLPIYMMADVIQVARKLAQRLRSFRRYRRISMNMEMRFPDATDEEIEQNEHCVICRESLFEGSKPKKLPCGHIFHIDCLRSWLVMQQVCPTCRAEIPPDGPLAGVSNADPAAADAVIRAMRNDYAAPAAEQRVEEPAVPAVQQPQPQAQPQLQQPLQPPLQQPQQPYHQQPTPQPQSAPPPQPAAAPSAVQAAIPSNEFSAATQANAPTAGSTNSVGSAAPARGVNNPPKMTASEITAAAASLASANVRPAPSVAAVPSVPSTTFSSAQLGAIGSFAALGSAATIATPPLEEMLSALKRAEDVSKFLREQTDFWMAQVRQIQKDHNGTVATGAVSAPGLAAGLAQGMATTVATPVAQAPAAEAPQTPNAATMTPLASGDASPSSARDQMAELRRAQQEAWERRRSSGSLSNVGGDTSQ